MSDADLTLANCAAEPIHIPGSIQPHGALFAFSAQRLLMLFARAASRSRLQSSAPICQISISPGERPASFAPAKICASESLIFSAASP